MAFTLLSGIPTAYGSDVLRGVRQTAAAPRSREGCIVICSHLTISMSAALAPLLSRDCLFVRLRVSSAARLTLLLAELGSYGPLSVAVAAQAKWGSLSLASMTDKGTAPSERWLLDMRREKTMPGSGASFARAAASLQRVLFPGAEEPQDYGRWRSSRNDASGEVRGDMTQMLTALSMELQRDDLGILTALVDVSAPFSDLYRVAMAWNRLGGDQPQPVQFDIRGEFRPDYFNIAPENIGNALAILERSELGEAMVSFWGLQWGLVLGDVRGGSVADALDLVSESGTWMLQLRTSAFADARHLAGVARLADRLLRTVQRS